MLLPAIFGITNDGVNLVVNLIVLALVVTWFALIYWTYVDAKRRLDDPVLIGCAVAASCFPYIGTLIYAIVRPAEYTEDARERELEVRAAELQMRELESNICPACTHHVQPSYLRCPSCGHRLKHACPSCSRPVAPDWRFCPYCEASLTGEAPPKRQQRARRTQPQRQPKPAGGDSRPAEQATVEQQAQPDEAERRQRRAERQARRAQAGQ